MARVLPTSRLVPPARPGFAELDTASVGYLTLESLPRTASAAAPRAIEAASRDALVACQMRQTAAKG